MGAGNLNEFSPFAASMTRMLLTALVFLVGEVLLFWLVRLLYRRYSGPGAVPFLDRLTAEGRLPADSPVVPLVLLGLYALVALLGVVGLFRALDTTQVDEVLAGSLPGRTPQASVSPATEVATLQSTAAEPAHTGGSPEGKIVYVCQLFKDGDRDQICMLSPAGGDSRRLTQNDDADYNFPSFAPDGKSVVYVGKEGPDRSFEVYEMDFAGSVNQLTDAEGDNAAPAISPDGSKIVFYRVLEGGMNSLWVMDRDGQNAHQIFGPPEGQGWDPTWSPDGSQILFASDLSGTIQLYVINVDGSNMQKITNIEGLRGRSDWSSDGQAIASYVGNSWEREIVVINPDGSEPHLVTSGGNNLAPSFSPDGLWITFTSYRDHYREDLGCEIYIMRRDGSSPLRLTDNDICDWQPRWGR